MRKLAKSPAHLLCCETVLLNPNNYGATFAASSASASRITSSPATYDSSPLYRATLPGRFSAADCASNSEGCCYLLLFGGWIFIDGVLFLRALQFDRDFLCRLVDIVVLTICLKARRNHLDQNLPIRKA